MLGIGLRLHRVHVVGMSMGGTLVGRYAAQYPRDMNRVTLVCPGSKYIALLHFIKPWRNYYHPTIPVTVEFYLGIMTIYSPILSRHNRNRLNEGHHETTLYVQYSGPSFKGHSREDTTLERTQILGRKDSECM